jgi:hypothetical protein
MRVEDERVVKTGNDQQIAASLLRRAGIGYTACENAASQAAGARGGDFLIE